MDRGVDEEIGDWRIDNIGGEVVGSVLFVLKGLRRLCEGDAFRGDGRRREGDSGEGVRMKLTSPILMVMLSGRAAVSAVMVTVTVFDSLEEIIQIWHGLLMDSHYFPSKDSH